VPPVYTYIYLYTHINPDPFRLEYATCHHLPPLTSDKVTAPKAMSAADCIAKLGDKKTAFEGLQAFESLFTAADAKARVSLYPFVPSIMEACGSKDIIQSLMGP
jgi:hypothetical protein